MTMTTAQALIKKAERREALFGVVGLGYVGLPLVDRARPRRLQGARLRHPASGSSTASTPAARTSRTSPTPRCRRSLANGRFEATTDLEPARRARRDLDLRADAALEVQGPRRQLHRGRHRVGARPTLRRGQAIILESTTYPGTTRELMLPALESTGLKVGEDFFLAFSPERVDPGNPVYSTRNTPKVVGGITPDCLEVAVALYQPAIDTLVPVSTTEAAELVKLLENTFRSVNIGLVNEMAIVCDKLGVDVWEVIDAAATKPFGFMKFTPGPGLGGHCIPIDPHYLAWKMRGAQLQDPLHRPGGRDQHRDAAVLGAEGGRRAERREPSRCKGTQGPGPRRRLQEGHRRPAREPGARHHPAARGAGRRRELPRSVRAELHRGRA